MDNSDIMDELMKELTSLQKRVVAAEGLLGFVLKTIGEPVMIARELVETGFTEGEQVYMTDHGDALEIGVSSPEVV